MIPTQAVCGKIETPTGVCWFFGYLTGLKNHHLFAIFLLQADTYRYLVPGRRFLRYKGLFRFGFRHDRDCFTSVVKWTKSVVKLSSHKEAP